MIHKDPPTKSMMINTVTIAARMSHCAEASREVKEEFQMNRDLHEGRRDYPRHRDGAGHPAAITNAKGTTVKNRERMNPTTEERNRRLSVPPVSMCLAAIYATPMR